MRRALYLLGLAVVLSGQTAPITKPDIAGGGGVTAIAQAGTARWITFRALDTNSTATCGASSVAGCVRIGDANISTSQGTYLKPGETFGLLESSGTQRHSLSGWYYLIQSGDHLSITYGQ